MIMELVSDVRHYPSETSVKVTSRSNIGHPVKTPPVLQVSSWRTWRLMMDMMSSLHLYSLFLSLPGVLGEVEVPDGHRDGVS